MAGAISRKIDCTRMPLYDFVCPACQYRFTDLTRANAKVHCPRCTQESNRLVSRFGIGSSEESRFAKAADELGQADSYAQALPLVRELGRSLEEDCSGIAEEAFEQSSSNPHDLAQQ